MSKDLNNEKEPVYCNITAWRFDLPILLYI